MLSFFLLQSIHKTDVLFEIGKAIFKENICRSESFNSQVRKSSFPSVKQQRQMGVQSLRLFLLYLSQFVIQEITLLYHPRKLNSLHPHLLNSLKPSQWRLPGKMLTLRDMNSSLPATLSNAYGSFSHPASFLSLYSEHRPFIR